ncbi:uncharacterized protein LOC115954171 isoform X2 [Quercus lobata]|uniref:uncharacterized protein LOC115954171 isoform X2 n=1 Tax=Quercus lobata TaxID=97700 RepID=UPI001247B065|nr:uncharacterized protein LOC115954171 isoform X2 [Quercus lobata]
MVVRVLLGTPWTKRGVAIADDNVLIHHYLHLKVIVEPLAVAIPELDVSKVKEPDKIWNMIWCKGDKDCVYFFTTESAAQSLLETCWMPEAFKVIYDEDTYPIAMKYQFCYANHESTQDGCWIRNLYGLKIAGSKLLLPPFSSPSYVAFKLCKNNLDENDQNKATNKKNVASTAATMSNSSTRAE